MLRKASPTRILIDGEHLDADLLSLAATVASRHLPVLCLPMARGPDAMQRAAGGVNVVIVGACNRSAWVGAATDAGALRAGRTSSGSWTG